MWLVLGASGQLGLSMRLALKHAGIDATFAGSTECDVTDKEAVTRTVASLTPKVVINCAAWTAVDDAEDHQQQAFLANCEGPRNLAMATRDIGSTLVHVSTDYVFSGTKAGAYLEDDPTDPQSTYGRSKLCGEIAVREIYPENSYIVRTAWLYSQFGGNFVKTMLRRALAHQPVRVVDDQHGQPTLALDLAHHLVAIVTSNVPKGIYHGTNSGEATWFEFAREIYTHAIGNSDLVSPVSSSEYPTKAQRPFNSVLDHARTRVAGIPEMRSTTSGLNAARLAS